MTGIAGLKTTKGVWPTDGIFPLSPTLDTPGPLARSLEDIKYIFNAYQSNLISEKKLMSLNGLTLAKLGSPFTDELDEEVSIAYESFCNELIKKGVNVIDLNLSVLSDSACGPSSLYLQANSNSTNINWYSDHPTCNSYTS